MKMSMKKVMDFFKINRQVFLISLVVLLFSMIVIDRSNSNELTYDFPSETADYSQIYFASDTLDHESRTYEILYKAYNIQEIGLRFYKDSEETNSGTVSLRIENSGKEIGTYTKDYSEIINGEINWFTIEKEVTAGNLQITIESDSVQPLGVSVYVDQEGTHLDSHFKSYEIPKNKIKLLVIGMLLMVTVIFLVAKMKKADYAGIFVISWLTVGFLFYVILPVMAEPDGGNHYRRMYDIISGNVLPSLDENNNIGNTFSWPNDWSKGDSIQISLYQQWNEMGFPIESDSKEWISYKNMALYSPLCYLPQMFGLFIGKIITGNLIPSILLARMMNFICIGILLYIAVRLTPVGKNLIVWTALLPMVMELNVGIAPDAMAGALITLLTAIVLRLRYTAQPVNKKYVVGICTLVFLLSQYKMVYVVFAILLFLIPKEKFLNTKNYCMAVAAGGIFTVIPALTWLKISGGILKSGYSNSASNIEVIFHPIKYFFIIVRTLIEKGDEYILQALGGNMGALSFGTNKMVVFLLLFFLAYEIGKSYQRSEAETINFLQKDRSAKWIIGGCIVVTSLLIFTAEYIQWTEYGLSIVEGVQGRYFLPFLFPVLLLCNRRTGNTVEYNQIYSFIAFDICFLSQLLLHYILLA